MKYAILVLTLICSNGFVACGQRAQQKSESINNQTNSTLDTSELTNETVKAAFDAWQKGDSKTFLSFFIADAKLYDDGSSRNFQGFVKEACGHEKFISISKVENEGMYIFGSFHAEKWGDFKTYFKFYANADGKFDRLDIGQAN